jgi:hypothetical protein
MNAPDFCLLARLEAHAALHAELAAGEGEAVLRWLGFIPPVRIRTALDNTAYLDIVAMLRTREAARHGRLALDIQEVVRALVAVQDVCALHGLTLAGFKSRSEVVSEQGDPEQTPGDRP